MTRSKGSNLFGRAGRRPQDEDEAQVDGDAGARRLTRAAFSKTLQQHTGRKSVFNVKGLHRLQETFHSLDRSIGSETSTQGSGNSLVCYCISRLSRLLFPTKLSVSFLFCSSGTLSHAARCSSELTLNMKRVCCRGVVIFRKCFLLRKNTWAMISKLRVATNNSAS